MLDRLRAGGLAGGAALILVLALSGGAMGAELVTDEVVDTTATFEDLDGDGVDDDCAEAEVVENAEAAAAAITAADLDGDGAISVTEAAQSGWTGGVNCNHGGYVSQVATADEDAEDEEAEDEEAPAEDTACEEVEAPEPETPLDTEAANAHGMWVSWVAGSDAVGGKNCNHGGAVSDAAKKDHEAAKAERDAAKAERDAAKAERAAERDAAKAEREAARAEGKGKGRNK